VLTITLLSLAISTFAGSPSVPPGPPPGSFQPFPDRCMTDPGPARGCFILWPAALTCVTIVIPPYPCPPGKSGP